MLGIFRSISIVIFAFVSVHSARILAVFSTPSISHQVVFRPFTQELAKRGHDVTVITTDPAFPKGKTPKNLKEINVHDSSYALWLEIFLNISSVSECDIFNRLILGHKAITSIFETQIKNDEVQKLLNDPNETFDVLVLEACARPAITLSHKYKHIPVIWFSSFGAYYGLLETVAGPYHPLLHMEIYQQKLHNLSLREEIKAMAQQYFSNNIVEGYEETETEMGRGLFGPSMPMTSKLMENADLVFLNLHASWDNHRPVPSTVVYLGGLPQKLDQELPKDLKTYLDSSKNGVIYVSFGTNIFISQIPKDKREILIKVLSRLPYNIICKWDDEVTRPPKNMMFGKWFPQSDLLKHPNVKLFITQGGLQSTDEAIAAGVPMLGIPMLGDQWFNVEQCGKFGLGIGLELETLTEEILLGAINTVIGDESYRKNILRYRTLVHDQPQSSLDRAVWWTEYLLRHGGKYLRSPAANMPLAEYLELELLCLLIVSVLSVIALIGYIVRRLCYILS